MPANVHVSVVRSAWAWALEEAMQLRKHKCDLRLTDTSSKLNFSGTGPEGVESRQEGSNS